MNTKCGKVKEKPAYFCKLVEKRFTSDTNLLRRIKKFPEAINNITTFHFSVP